jgi:hypothetical protein
MCPCDCAWYVGNGQLQCVKQKYGHVVAREDEGSSLDSLSCEFPIEGFCICLILFYGSTTDITCK